MHPDRIPRIHLPDAHQILIYPSSYEKLQTNPYRYVPLHGLAAAAAPVRQHLRRLAVPSGAAQQLVSGHGPRHGAHRPDGQPDHRRPYFRLNERGVQWVDKEDWIYETHFEADAGLLARERIELVFEGARHLCRRLPQRRRCSPPTTCSRRWRTEVKRLLRPGENTLKVYFHSPIKVDLPKYDSLPYRYEAVNDQSANGGLFDKRVSVFAPRRVTTTAGTGGPRLVTSGIWRPVYLEGWAAPASAMSSTASRRLRPGAPGSRSSGNRLRP